MNKNIWYIIAAVALVMGVIAIIRVRRENNKTELAPVSTSGERSEAKEPANVSFWEGTLRQSDSPKKGNFMLVSGKTTVYINTSRDFSGLLGKEVKVTYQGTLESFELGDITAK